MPNKPLFFKTAVIFLNFIFLVLNVSSVEASDFDSLKSKVKTFSLDNGMKFVLVSRDVAPVFSAQIWVKVGGVDELPGASGAAHLLEHMAFKGTEAIGTKDYAKEKKLIEKYDSLFELNRENPSEEKVKKLNEIKASLSKLWDVGKFTGLYQQRGANGLNAGTSKDYTVYTVGLPSSELEFWFSIESERLLKPVFRQFYEELEVVHEERRMRTDDNPSGLLYEALLATAYWNHPYSVPTIGWKEDLNNLLKKDAEYLHETYYRPDNIVVSIVGDIDFSKAKKLAKLYFGRISKPTSEIPERKVILETQNGKRITKVHFSSEPELMMGYHIPTTPSEESLHFSLLSTILDEGRSSVFQKTLVRDEEIFSNISSGEAPGHRYDPVFLVSAKPRSGINIDDSVERIQQLFDTLKEDETINDERVAAAIKRIKISILKSIQSNSGLARYLGMNELLYGGWEALFEELEKLEEITPDDIKKSIDKYLTKSNRSVSYIE